MCTQIAPFPMNFPFIYAGEQGATAKRKLYIHLPNCIVLCIVGRNWSLYKKKNRDQII